MVQAQMVSSLTRPSLTSDGNASTCAASPAAPEVRAAVGSPTAGHVFLGTCNPATGAWTEPAFVGLPDCAKAMHGEVVITSRHGSRLRADHSPTASEVALIHTGQQVHLLTMINVNTGDGPAIYWGKVQANASAALFTDFIAKLQGRVPP